MQRVMSTIQLGLEAWQEGKGGGIEDRSCGRGRQRGGVKGISTCGFVVSIHSLLSIELFSFN